MVSLTDLQERSRIDYQTSFDRYIIHCLEREKIKWNILVMSWTAQEWNRKKRRERYSWPHTGVCVVFSIFIKPLRKIRNIKSSLKYIYCTSHLIGATVIIEGQFNTTRMALPFFSNKREREVLPLKPFFFPNSYTSQYLQSY